MLQKIKRYYSSSKDKRKIISRALHTLKKMLRWLARDLRLREIGGFPSFDNNKYKQVKDQDSKL